MNRCDWIASASINEENPIEEEYRNLINDRICARFSSLKPLQEFMGNHSEDNIALIASTGGGKTEGALLWLNGEKGFFTLPMKVSANSIFERIHQFYLSNVAILHSDCFAFYGKNQNENLEQKTIAQSEEILNYQIAKNLSYPL
ncbi:CRISPR-associated helicase/endonuclease Cas3, partial [Coprobacillus cateniformis]|nr:CRISPR-associated helicase/endonuclease Cas3 [Coprobacillus cateniformis]